MKISQALSKPYPGRGIIIGRTDCSNKAVIAYFIMGRSENSRNRIFAENGDGISSKAFDESKVVDPSLIIYNPVRADGNRILVTNGVQTDEIAESMDTNELTFEQALQLIEFEPDPPIYTPRISGIIGIYGNSDVSDNTNFDYTLSIAKTADGNPDSCSRFTYSYQPLAGKAHFIHTYGDEVDGVPTSFSGEPVSIDLNNECSDIDGFTNAVWSSLNEANKVSLFTRFIDLKSGNTESRVVNKHE